MPDPLRCSLIALALSGLCGCGSSDPPSVRAADHGRPDSGVAPSEAGTESPVDAATFLPDVYVPPITQRAPNFCDRPSDDGVRDVFCAGTTPTVEGLSDLHRLLLVPTETPGGLFQSNTSSFLSHSTSLAGHLVSTLNPRSLVPSGEKDVFVAFQRGAQQVEIAARTRDQSTLNFYLLTFRQACNEADGGCRPGDLFTPSIEKDWKYVAIQDDEELKNTPADCRQCHQRGREKPTLIMRELLFPWTHFFAPEGDPRSPVRKYAINGGLLTTEYLAAKGDEPYGNCAALVFQRTFGGTLQVFVDAQQPLLFDAPSIMAERFPRDVADWPGAPQHSATWEYEYAAFKRGDHLPLPYFDAHATDPDKQQRLSDAYASFRAGTLASANLPDLADIFPDDPQTRAEIGLEAEPNATPAEALVQACGTCHNDVLDQSISRARFNVDVTRLERDELERAIDRLSRPKGTAGAMPPPDARQLTPEVRARVVTYLREASFPESDHAFLEHAASAGMAGGATYVPTTPVDAGYTEPRDGGAYP